MDRGRRRISYKSQPFIFDKYDAAKLVAKGFSLEEEISWVVLFKDGRYRPINIKNLQEAVENGYEYVRIRE